jgi:hypothetical protein
MIKPEQIKFLRDHPVQKSLFPDSSEKNRIYLALVPHTFMIGEKDNFGIGLSVTHDGYILEENCPQVEGYINRIITEKSAFLERMICLIGIASEHGEKKGSYIALNTVGSNSFWHWMMDNVIRAAIAMDAGFDGYYIIPHYQFAKESLEMIGIPENKIILFDETPCILERLCVPQLVSFKRFPRLIQKTRDKFLQSVGKADVSNKRIYIARHNFRTVVNEPELTELLNRYNFRQIVMEDYPLKEQIRIASEADCVIAPHGAGMVHTLFMRSNSLVLELFSPMYINPCMLPVIDYLKHRYYMIPSNSNYCVGEYPHQLNVEANIPMIELTLKRELKA